MKKLIIFVLVAVMALSLTSCFAKVECDLCGEEKSKFKMNTEELFGEEVNICDDCAEDLEELGNLFG